jgi:hypothetical protein
MFQKEVFAEPDCHDLFWNHSNNSNNIFFEHRTHFILGLNWLVHSSDWLFNWTPAVELVHSLYLLFDWTLAVGLVH